MFRLHAWLILGFSVLSSGCLGRTPLDESVSSAALGHTATLLPDGRVPIMGGTLLNTVEIYTP